MYLRIDTFGTFEAQQTSVDRVRALADQGVFDVAGVEAEWEGVHIREDEERDGALATYDEFADWTAANGFALEPAFDRRPRYVPGSTERREAVVFPVVSLAVYEGPELRAVLPCSDAFGHYTVHESLEGFERGDLDRWLTRFTGVTVDRTAPHLGTVTAL